MTTHTPGFPLPVSAVENPLGASPALSLSKLIVMVCACPLIAASRNIVANRQPIVFICSSPFLSDIDSFLQVVSQLELQLIRRPLQPAPCRLVVDHEQIPIRAEDVTQPAVEAGKLRR